MGNTDVVTAAYEAFGRGDVPAIIDLVDDNVEWCVPMTLPQGGQFTGKQGVGRFFEGIGAGWESLTIEREALGAVSDDLVVVVATGSGQLRSGGPATYSATHVFTVRSGKITRFREYTDLDKPLNG